MGFQKRGTDEVRPSAIGWHIVRAWHKCLLMELPEPTDDQWCGRPGVGAVEATANWPAADGDMGAESDLRKAFDSVAHEAGSCA